MRVLIVCGQKTLNCFLPHKIKKAHPTKRTTGKVWTEATEAPFITGNWGAACTCVHVVEDVNLFYNLVILVSLL